MQAQEFIVQTMNTPHTNHTQILLQDEYLKALYYFGENLDLILEQYIKLSANEKNSFIRNIADLLPLSKKIFAMCLEHADTEDNLSQYLKDANEKYLDILFDCFDGTNFNDTYIEIESEIEDLNDKLEKLANEYLLSTKKRVSLAKELEETTQKNTKEIQEIEELEKQKHSLESSLQDFTTQIEGIKQDVATLDRQLHSLRKELNGLTATKTSYEQELHTLEEKQKQNNSQLQEIEQERQKLLMQEKEFQEAKSSLETMKRKIESLEEDTKTMQNTYHYYTGKDAKEIQKKLNEIEGYFNMLKTQHPIKTQESEIVKKVENR